MKSLKRKILRPLFLIIVLIPLVSILVLNTGIRTVESKMAKEELSKIIKISGNRKKVLDLVNKDFPRVINIRSMLLALKSTRYNTNLEYILFNDKYNCINFNINDKIENGSFLTEKLINKLQNKLLKLEEGLIYNINSNNEEYLYTLLKTKSNSSMVYVVLVSKINSSKSTILIMNIIFISIAIFSAVISLTLIYIIINQLTKPINKLCYYSNMIGEGKFIDIPINNKFTEIYELTSHMNNMSKQLSKMNNAQKSLIQNISHEFKTPLTAIASYAEGMKLGVFKDVDKATSVIIDESQRINILVEQILTLSRIENVNYTYDMENLVLNNCLLDYVQSLQAISIKENKYLDLKLDIHNIVIKGNNMLLSQVINNVVVNCLRYAYKKVTISLIENDTIAEIVIRDDGDGFSEEDLPYIFDRFYKGEKGKFGLGLTIAKSSVEHMSGKIIAENSDCGATFIIKFPIIQT